MEKKILFAVTILLSWFVVSCSNDKSGPSPKEEGMEFVHNLIIGENSYISLFKDLNVGELNTDKALIFHKGSFTYVYKNKVYVTDTEHLHKYTVNGDVLVQDGETLLFPSNAMAGLITFASETKAYVSCIGLGKIWIINPSTMQKTGEIDLSEYALGRESGDNNPEPAGSIIRDGILYVGLMQGKSGRTFHPGAHVLLIDINNDSPIKMISDERAAVVTMMEAVGDPFMDEKGDIYFYAAEMAYGGPNEGFLRIKKNETVFDASYYFPVIGMNNIEGLEGHTSSYVYKKAYFKNGKMYGLVAFGDLLGNPPNWENKYLQTCEIDIYNKTLKKLKFDGTTGWGSAVCVFGDDIIFGMNSTQGTGYYVYHTKDGSYENMKIKTVGETYAIIPLK